MYLSEDYNSPQSPYWSLKALIVVSLSQDSQFWSADEQPYPSALFTPQLVPAPRQIVSNHPGGNHHFCLSPAQFVAWPLKATQAKYCKFEYSSTFSFSVPTGPLIQQIAPDCTLALSRDGAETWAVKWKCAEPTFFPINLDGRSTGSSSSVTAASVRWSPWGDGHVDVETTLIPPTDRWPDWVIRVHRIRVRAALRSLHTVEGGFAAPGRRAHDGTALPSVGQVNTGTEVGIDEGVLTTEDSTLILSSVGASGISAGSVEGTSSPRTPRRAHALKPDANTNLAHQRTLIPVISGDISSDLQAGDELLLITRVFAVSATANSGRRAEGTLVERWMDKPVVSMGQSRGVDHIRLGPQESRV